MGLEEIYEKLINATRPIDVFGDVTKDDIKHSYRRIGKICHPDALPEEKKAFGEEIMKLLNKFHSKALQEFEEGIYNLTDVRDLYKRSNPTMEFELSGKKYKFYEHIVDTDAGEIYRGMADDDIVYLKVALEEKDNALLESEVETLSILNHQSLPNVLDKLKINGLMSIIFSDFKGMPFEEFENVYGNIGGEHIVWMLERMLSCVGYLHSKNIVHGNIKPGNIYINPEVHNIIMLDYSLCINEANEYSARYRIINNHYTAPEVGVNSRVYPNTDIYSVGKLAIKLLGGDINSGGMPIKIDIRIRDFIRKLVNDNGNARSNDAYALWDEVIDLRNRVYGKERFKKLEKKYKGGI